MPLRRPSDDYSVASSSPASSVGTKRRFPLLGRKKNRTSDFTRPSSLPVSVLPTATSPSSPKIKKPCLRVRVQVKFENPVSQEHSRDYEASPQLVASDRVCQALLSRLQHCSTELITRHDCSALDPLRKPHRDVKPLRYRITYRVERDGLTLLEKTLRSFQEYAPTADDAREVLSAIDRMVGLFLLRHDPGFRWPEPPEAEQANSDSETVRPYTGRPQSTCCVPRSRFVHANQAFELVPGYTIELFLRSRCATRYPENRNASIKIDSRQTTPLTLLLGEELTTRVSNLIIDPIDSWKRKFDKRHRNCNGFEGSGGCTHVEDGAVDVMVKVRNNLGPDYNYFSHRIQTSKVLFNDPNGRDFDEFANSVKAKLEKARDMSDKSLRSLDDLTLRIRELRGKNWSVHEPLTVRLDSSVTYCRQTVEAIMERLQSGISNVLETHEDALAIMTVHKRGHLIFDGFLDGAEGDDSIRPEKFSSPALERKALESKLKDRIRADITMLCKDTCSLECNDYLSNLKIRATGASAGPRDNTRPENMRRPSSAERSVAESIGSGSGSIRSDHTLAKKQAQQNLRETSLPPSTPVSLPPAELQRVPSGVEMAKKYGYMGDFIADEEDHHSEPPSTPSLVDTDSIGPRDSIIATPSRIMPHDQSNEGLRIIDDGRKIIYEEQSDVDAITRGVTSFDRYADDEPIQLLHERGTEAPMRRATRRSLDTRMPDLSGNLDPVPFEVTKSTSGIPRKEEKPKKTVVIIDARNAAPAVADTTSPTPVVDLKKPEEQNAPATSINDPVASVQTERKLDMTPKDTAVATVETPVPVHTEKSESSDQEQQETVETMVTVEPVISASTPQAVETNVTPETNIQEEAVQKFEDKTPGQLEETVTETFEREVSPMSDVTEGSKTDVVLDDFPEPPTEHKHEGNDEVVEKQPQVEEPTREAPPIPLIETPTVEAEERQETLVETVETIQPEGIRSSSDSGISMEEQSREEEPKDMIPEKESSHEEADVVEPELPVITSAAESAPSENQTRPVIHQDLDYQSSAILPSPTLEPVPEEDIDDELGAPKRLVLDTDAPASSTPSTPPKEKLLTPEERCHMLSALEELPEPPRFPLILRRPRTNTLPERRYSTALTLEIDTKRPGPEWASQDHSPIDPPPKSAIFPAGRRGLPGHFRQPSAGWIGLRDQRMHEVGLRNALVPYRWRAMRLDQEWGNRPSTSYSEQ